MGIYWGSASSPGCREVVESSDAYLFAGPIFSDYTTVGFSALIQPARMVEASTERILVEGQVYHGIVLAEFLTELASKLKPNTTSLDAYLRIKEAPQVTSPAAPKELALSTRRLFYRINEILDETTTIVAETGDSWFNGMDLASAGWVQIRNPDAVRLHRLVGGGLSGVGRRQPAKGGSSGSSATAPSR